MKDKLIKKIFKLIEEEPENWCFKVSAFVYARYNFDDGTIISVAPIDSANMLSIAVYSENYKTLYYIDMQSGTFAMPFGWRRRMCRKLMKIYMNHVNNKVINNTLSKEFEDKHLSDIYDENS